MEFPGHKDKKFKLLFKKKFCVYFVAKYRILERPKLVK